MPAGTIKLTNNSTAVTGTGTSFSNELAANDFLVAVVGGVTYTLGVKSVESDTVLTLTAAYNGPTTTGLAWTPVPNATLVVITAQVAADVAKAIRGLNLDKNNWQQVYSGTGNITVTLPDGSQFTGPSWNYVASNTLLRSDIGTAAGTVAAGNDSRLNTIDKKSGGVINGDVSIESNNLNLRSTTPSGGWTSFVNFMAGQGNNVLMARMYHEDSGSFTVGVGLSSTAKYFNFLKTGQLIAPGNITCVSLTQTSDKNKKKNIAQIESALDKIRQIGGYTYELKDTEQKGAGVIAQELEKVLPEAVGKITRKNQIFDNEGDATGQTEEDTSYTVDYSAVSALAIAAIKELMSVVDRQAEQIAELQARMKAIDGLDP
ncbi:tail fiber domain-containing protein [Mixta calida]|uniref:tail fiber domain-containing protein n=1 Tax=Mixta calida TaxID=665913 RepID=UPI002908DB86|nr:tail fiber domain-containing protein [Mixta calida]MDU4288316.1 tail fiber domain-containing protein [Mixta calida]